METLLSTTGSKWISRTPIYAGDLIHNMGSYYPRPNYEDPYWKMLHMNAEAYAYGRSRAKAGYDRQAMFYYPASSGWSGWQVARQFADKIVRQSERFISGDDKPYFGVRRLGDILDPEVMGGDVFAQNYRDSRILSSIAAQNIRNPETGKRDTYIISPDRREQYMREIMKNHSLLRGAAYEDAVWEVHLWGPLCLHNDTTHGILGGPRAWSGNAPLEEAVGVAAAFGAPELMAVRRGQSFSFIDVMGQPVSFYDQVHEICRHLVYEIPKPVEVEGEKYEVRSENAAALVVACFMHDELFRNGDYHMKDRAGETIKAHYADEAEKAKLAKLRETMLPFLAEYCNWPTLHEMLDQDPHMKAFWEKHVEPSKPNLKPIEEISKEVLSYLPRGGFENRTLNQYVTERRDPPVLQFGFRMADLPDVAQHLPQGPFTAKYDPKMYNDRCFARLGQAGNPDDEPDPDHLTFDQTVAMHTLATFLHDGIPPLDMPNRVLYLDDPTGGIRASAWMAKNKVGDPKELSGLFDALANGSAKYVVEAGAENAADFQDRVRELMKSRKYEKWRDSIKAGSVDCLSDISAEVGSYTGRREGTDTEKHEAFAAGGSMHASGRVVETVARRLIGLEENGIVLPAGHLTGLQSWCVSEGLMAATGLTPRAYSGGNYKHEFFMDFDYWKPPQQRGEPAKLDLADLIIHMGLANKAQLEKPNPPSLPDYYVPFARVLDVYERILDPERRNKVSSSDDFSGDPHKEPIIDLSQIDPELLVCFPYDESLPEFSRIEDPAKRKSTQEYDAFFKDTEYQAFRQPEASKPADFYTKYMSDPVQKARLAKMIWAWSRAEAIEVKPNVYWPVPGNLTFRGIASFDNYYLRDLHNDYRESHKAWQNLSDWDRKGNIFRQHSVDIRSPGIDVR